MIKINSIIDYVKQELLEDGILIEQCKRLNVTSGQRKNIYEVEIKGKRYMLKLVDVTPESLKEEQILSENVKNDICYMSYRAMNEIEMSKKCPNLPQLMKINKDDFKYIITENMAFLYYIEDKIEGNTLNYKNSYTVEEILSFLGQMAKNIRIMSNNGYIHRDIKPSNIIENKGNYFLIDGGICKKIEDELNLTMIGSAIGTNRYLAPEQEKVLKDIKWTFQTDLYPLGIIATEMFIPETRTMTNREIRDIQIVGKKWIEKGEVSVLMFKTIIANLLNEIRALRFNNIDELILKIEKIRKEVAK